MRIPFAIAAVVLLLGTPDAHAHVTLENKEARVGGPYKAVFRVPHGCGTAATIALRVRIPEGVIGVKPMPKPGWQVEMTRQPYGKTYTMFHSVKVSEGVREIVWRGMLPNDYYDEFVISAYLTEDLKPGSMLYFPVVQECEGGAVQPWTSVPQASSSPKGHGPSKHGAGGHAGHGAAGHGEASHGATGTQTSAAAPKSAGHHGDSAPGIKLLPKR